MATAAQITANRLNAQHSTGPRTAAGRTASSRNAIRHNLCGSSFTLLPGEDVTAFEQLARDYLQEFAPQTAHETFLVTQMIQAQWRLSRIERLQAEALDIILNVPHAAGKSDEAAIIAAIPFAHGNTLDRLDRYGRAAERAYFRANRELKQYRASKPRQNVPESTVAPKSASRAEQNEADSFVLPRPAVGRASGMMASALDHLGMSAEKERKVEGNRGEETRAAALHGPLSPRVSC